MSYRLFFVVPALLAISTSAAQSQDMRSWYCMDGCAETYAGDIDYCYEEYEEGSEEYEACIDQADGA